MKVNHYLSIMAAVLLSALSIGFTACSQDEVDEPQQTKVDLLKAKAKEFAEKYGVEMSLNEDNIAQIAETLSVEQMEKDFQNFAKLKDSLSAQTKPTPLKNKAKTRGLKIRTTVPLEETAPPVGSNDGTEADRYKEYKGSVSGGRNGLFQREYNGKKENIYISVDVTVSWSVKLNSNSRMDVSVSSNGRETRHDIVCYYSTSNGFSVYGGGTIWVITERYKFKFGCTVAWSEKSNGNIVIT